MIRADTLGMAKDIDEAVDLVKSQPQAFGNFLAAQAAIRALPIAYLIDGRGKILATAAAQNGHALPGAAAPGPWSLPRAARPSSSRRGRAPWSAPSKQLENFNDTYLYVIRPVNAQVLQQLRAHARQCRRISAARSSAAPACRWPSG